MDRIVTLHFIDGSKLAFEFPQQTANTVARQMKFADLLAGKHFVVEAEGQVFVFPVTSIKYLTFSLPALPKERGGTLPRHAISGARVRA
jgi:hypothetical protein